MQEPKLWFIIRGNKNIPKQKNLFQIAIVWSSGYTITLFKKLKISETLLKSFLIDPFNFFYHFIYQSIWSRIKYDLNYFSDHISTFKEFFFVIILWRVLLPIDIHFSGLWRFQNHKYNNRNSLQEQKIIKLFSPKLW